MADEATPQPEVSLSDSPAEAEANEIIEKKEDPGSELAAAAEAAVLLAVSPPVSARSMVRPKKRVATKSLSPPGVPLKRARPKISVAKVAKVTKTAKATNAKKPSSTTTSSRMRRASLVPPKGFKVLEDGPAFESTRGNRPAWTITPPDEEAVPWPKGWIKSCFVRQSGASKGATDFYWYPPDGGKLRSIKEVERYLQVWEKTKDHHKAFAARHGR